MSMLQKPQSRFNRRVWELHQEIMRRGTKGKSPAAEEWLEQIVSAAAASQERSLCLSPAGSEGERNPPARTSVCLCRPLTRLSRPCRQFPSASLLLSRHQQHRPAGSTRLTVTFERTLLRANVQTTSYCLGRRRNGTIEGRKLNLLSTGWAKVKSCTDMVREKPGRQ